ncbi:MAG: hypothetical protein Q4P18_07980 [Methanobrevibacter sp.]|uniref:hypothetical protein n=1 Tax=Methanobrevibacter sp. TaxID=66852 RepID=UPI0026DF5F51|nr:hypothetical protein [Methanobrevibacter sp.]MDO5849459.1 hypothetical protein [Methanobrevibacter sp.]
MNTDYIIENLRFEILRPYHNLSDFKCGSRKLNRYLRRQALEDQKLTDRVTHLVICNAELIAYFSIRVYFEGIPEEDYEEIRKTLPDIPEANEIPLAEISHFAIDRKYESPELAAAIFDNIIYNLKNIFKTQTSFRGVSITIGDDCLFPIDDSIDMEVLEREVLDVIREKEKEGEYFFVKEIK